MKKIAILAVGLGLGLSAYANNWVKATNITNFNQSVSALQAKNTGLPIVFPAQVPSSKTAQYFGNYDTTSTGYDLYVDSTKDCAGAKYCNLLTLNANKTSQALPTYKNMQGKMMTSTLTLQNGVKANYTPGFAMGDYWNPQIAWQQNGVTYTLSWVGIKSVSKTKRAMVNMANHLQTLTSNQAGS